jgi:nucleoside-diphosphate-sugar epimerase
MKFTVLGGSGFVGRNLIEHLQASGHQVWAPARDALTDAQPAAGHVIYAIGLTGDYRHKLYETVEAHVVLLSRLLQTWNFDSWLYLSSTRVYHGLPADGLASETSVLPVVPNAYTIYDLSKLLGEAMCLAHPRDTVRVARVANVLGAGQDRHTFFGSVLSEVRRNGRVTIEEAPGCLKDYIPIEALVPLLERIAVGGRERIYNVASGTQMAHAQIAEKLGAATGAKIEFAKQGPLRSFPRIDVGRIQSEFDFKSPSTQSILDYIGNLATQEERQCLP